MIDHDCGDPFCGYCGEVDPIDISSEFLNAIASKRQIGGDHYQKSIQPWDYMEAIMSEEAFKGYIWGNVIKYISRWEDKGGRQDLEKAKHYLEKLLETV